ncbi:hypothetical protein [Pantoea agglomerans]|uniref:hypothetical protein n=1 Tax=Enterobacter agglomerans TaxID=549 RepID=UPI003209133A
MALDHGLLNIPIEQRGNFHNELDDHLAAEKRRKSDALFLRKSAFNDAHSKAQQLYLMLDTDLIRAEAKRRGMKLTEFREVLKSIRDSQPKRAPVAFAPFVQAKYKACSHCGRQYGEPTANGVCPSDDCPSNEEEKQ